MRTLLLPAALLVLSACVEDVGKGKVKADVQDVPAATAEPAKAEADASATSLAVDPSQSSLKALGAKVTATHPIDFKTYSGKVTVDGDKVTGIAFEVDMASLEADHPKLTAHLKNEDFFDVPNHPKATFSSVSVKEGAEAEGDWTHTVSGDFTIRGNTKRVTFPAKIDASGKGVKASTEFVIDRKDFGVVYPGRPDDLVQDNVRMTISFMAPKA